jgi:hypothetical protein
MQDSAPAHTANYYMNLLNETFEDLKACDDGILILLLNFWTLSITPFFILKQRFRDWTLSLSSGKSLSLVLDIGTSSIDWAQLSRLLPENGGRVQIPKRF